MKRDRGSRGKLKRFRRERFTYNTRQGGSGYEEEEEEEEEANKLG